MKELTRFWGLVGLGIRGLGVRQSVKEGLYLLSSLTEMPPQIFSRSISAWTKRLKALQPYVYRDPEQSRLPDKLDLLDDYPSINNRIQAEIATFPNQPLITFLVPVYAAPNDLLEATLRSMRLQLYSRFEVYLIAEIHHHAELQRLSAGIFPNSLPVLLKELVDAESLSTAFN